ncbi:hypothetical protein [Halalkalibacter urbisdiaboli]|nr:hypothetical protein [Halalkalibacter urbisdiaboli]
MENGKELTNYFREQLQRELSQIELDFIKWIITEDKDIKEQKDKQIINFL